MKTIFSKSIAILFLFVLFSCSKDSPTANVTPEIIKTKIKISKIEINQIPLKDSNNIVWDIASNPDIYIKLYDESNSSSYTSNYVPDAFPTISNPLGIYFVDLSSTNLTTGLLKIQVWDDDLHDFPSTADQKIGDISFYINDYTIGTNKYPSFAVKSVNGTIITIYMTWE